MNPAYIFGGLVLGLAAGVLSGIIGIGGGILLIPALVYAFGMTQLKAQGTSLAVLLLPVGILAVIPYYRDGQIDLRLAALIAVGFAFGGWFGGSWGTASSRSSSAQKFRNASCHPCRETLLH